MTRDSFPHGFQPNLTTPSPGQAWRQWRNGPSRGGILELTLNIIHIKPINDRETPLALSFVFREVLIARRA